jgi:hypothetical protein
MNIGTIKYIAPSPVKYTDTDSMSRNFYAMEYGTTAKYVLNNVEKQKFGFQSLGPDDFPTYRC